MESNCNESATHPNTEQTQTQEDKNKCRDYKENDVWKENHITIFQEPKLENSQGRNGKSKWIINTYPNEEHHGIKWTYLCRSKIILS